MKIFKVILILIFAKQITFGQDLNGTYKSDGLHINFTNDYAEFALASDGCVIYIYKGCGKYELIEDFLIIHTEQYCKEKSSFNKINTNSDTAIIQILDDENDFDIANYANVTFIDKSENILYTLPPDNNGIIYVKDICDIESFYVLAPGYQQIKIDFKPKVNYIITMVNGDIYENKTLIYQIDILDNSSFNLYRLGEIKNTKKNILRQLKRAKRRREMHKKRYPYRIDKFVKE